MSSYLPGSAPAVFSSEASRMLRFMEEELQEISRAFSETLVLELRPSFSPPEKPKNGEIRYADGTSWNPGGGEGIYARVAGAWVKLH